MTSSPATPALASTASDFTALTSLSQAVMDAMPAAVCVWTADGRVARHNRRARTLGGGILQSPGFGETPLATVLRTGRALSNIPLTVEQPDGVSTATLVDIEPLIDGDGKIEGAIGYCRELAGQGPLKAAQSEGERRWRDLLEALPTAVYTTDARGRIDFFNQAAVDLWGYRPTLGESEWCGSWRLFQPDGTPLPHDQCPMAIALRENRSIRGEEAIAERPDGARVPFRPYPTPLYDLSGTLTGAVNMLIDISFHKDAEARQQLLINELNHRVKNSLASVQSIVAQTLRRADDLDTARGAIEQRLLALAHAHNILNEETWRNANLRKLLRTVVASFVEPEDRLRLEGPDVWLSPKTTLALAMALHELVVNALKHGALSADHGRVLVAWRTEDRDGAGRLVLDWLESDGPGVTAPVRQGFGVRLIERGLADELGGDVRLGFPPTGVTCRIDIPLVPAT